jgi:hypothetical protein
MVTTSPLREVNTVASRLCHQAPEKEPPGSRTPAAFLTDAMIAPAVTQLGNHFRNVREDVALVIAVVDEIL